MSRKPRHQIVKPGMPHHVVTRGNNRRRLFSYARDYRQFLRLLSYALLGSAIGCVLNQLTLMANHVHMIVTPVSADALARFMKQVCQRYAQQRNLRRQATGKLFEQRYWCRPIESTEQLARTTAYNDTNAVQSGMVSDPFTHRWSTMPLHAGADPVEPLIRSFCTPSVWYEGLAADDPERALAYREWVLQYLESKELPESLKGCDWIEDLERPYTLRLERPNRTRASDVQERDWENLRGMVQEPSFFLNLEGGE